MYPSSPRGIFSQAAETSTIPWDMGGEWREGGDFNSWENASWGQEITADQAKKRDALFPEGRGKEQTT